MNINSNTYSSESKVKDWRNVLKSMVNGLIGGRYLAFRLFIKEIKADYSNSQFGILWDFLEPIVLASIFILLMYSRVINSGNIHIPYAVFVIYGMLLWQTFSESLTFPFSILQQSKTLLNQIKIPPEALWISVLLKILFNSFFRIIILFMFSFFMDALSWTGFLKFLLLYPLIILVGMAFGVLLTPFNVIYNDISKVVKISLRPLMYASPVLYATPPAKFLIYLNMLNPPGIVLSNLRSLATQNYFENPIALIIVLIISLLTFLIGWFIFHISIPILSDKL